MINSIVQLIIIVAPVRERGLKFGVTFATMLCHGVAPVRERGLKCPLFAKRSALPNGRSREGAWIEISKALQDAQKTLSLP